DQSGKRDWLLADRGAPENSAPALDLTSDLRAGAESMTAEAIVERYFGPASPFSPALRAEFLYRSGSTKPGHAFSSLLNDLERPSPIVYSRYPIEEVEKHSIRVRNDLLLSCIELAAGSGMLRYEFDGFSEAAETYYGIVRQAAAFDRQYDTLRRRLAGELKK